MCTQIPLKIGVPNSLFLHNPFTPIEATLTNTVKEFGSVLTGGSVVVSPKVLQDTLAFHQGPPLPVF